MSPPNPPLSPPTSASDVAALLDWWRLAGVDCVYREEAQAWLPPSPGEEPISRAGSTSLAPPINIASADRRTIGEQTPVRIGGDPAHWPANLEQFRQWWLEEASLAEAGAFPRLSSRGDRGAAVMLIVPEPEEVDRDTLLSGQRGAMARLILRAMRIDESTAYLASVLPRHTPLVDWQALAMRGLGDVVAHHIALASPQRVVVFGRAIAGLFAPGDTVLCAPGLDELRRSAQRRERFWRNWMQWMGRVAQ